MLQNLIKSVRWELAVFFTKYPYFFLLPAMIFTIFVSVHVFIITNNFYYMLLVIVGLEVPILIFSIKLDDLIMFKVMGFQIHKILIKDVFVTWKKTIKSVEDFLKENDIKYFRKKGFPEWDDVELVFKNNEDANYVKIAFKNDSFPSKP